MDDRKDALGARARRGGRRLLPLADLHVHSTFSADARDDLASMCQAAVDRGLQHICFTEHVDYNPADLGYGFFREQAFFTAVEEARHEFAGRLEILKGVEFGEPHNYPREFERLLTKDYDLIVAGIHAVDSLYLGERALEEQFTTEEIYERYFAEVLAAVRFGGFDVLAHLDLPKRYLGETDYPMELVAGILGELVEADLALEINTSPLRKGLPECAPDLAVLEQYVALGGRKLTVGSDAHARGEIATGFDRAQHLIELTGAGPAGIYRRRRFVAVES